MAWKRASLAAACLGSLYAGAASAQTVGVDYNLAKTQLPTLRIPASPPKFEASVVEVVKPTPVVVAPATTPKLPEPPAPEPPKVVVKDVAVAVTPMPTAPSIIVEPPKVVVSAPKAPTPVAPAKAPVLTAREPAPMTVGVARAVSPTPMNASFASKERQVFPALPTGESAIPYDPRICAECVRILGASPIDSDREKALATLGRVVDWQHYRPAYQALRRVALTEYSTKMRMTAVRLLATANSDHALVADTLKLSAQYDSESAIRGTAVAMLEKLASAPPSRFVR